MITGYDTVHVEIVALDSEHGTSLTYDGIFDDDQIVVHWFRDPEVRRLQSRYVLKKIDQDRFELSSYLSTDYGDNWALTHQRIYSR